MEQGKTQIQPESPYHQVTSQRRLVCDWLKVQLLRYVTADSEQPSSLLIEMFYGMIGLLMEFFLQCWRLRTTVGEGPHINEYFDFPSAKKQLEANF